MTNDQHIGPGGIERRQGLTLSPADIETALSEMKRFAESSIRDRKELREMVSTLRADVDQIKETQIDKSDVREAVRESFSAEFQSELDRKLGAFVVKVAGSVVGAVILAVALALLNRAML